MPNPAERLPNPAERLPNVAERFELSEGRTATVFRLEVREGDDFRGETSDEVPNV